MMRLQKVIRMGLALSLSAMMILGCGAAKAEAVGISSYGSVNAKKSKTSEVTIEEKVLFEQDGIKITAKGFESGGFMGPKLKLLIENNTDNDVTIQARKASINGYMVDTLFSADVAAGKKTNDSIGFLDSDLELAGITTVADMAFSFHIFDSDTWDSIIDSDMIAIETSAAKDFKYEFDDSGKKVYENDDIEIVVKGLSEEGSWLGPAIIVYISNTGDRDITVQARDVSINGFMVDPIFSSDVASGKHAIDTITFMSSDLEENDIETIETVELSFHVFDEESWDTIEDTDSITIDF